MGDIKRQRKKYSGPSKPYEKERIEEEKKLMREYGFKNKRELWKMESLLKEFKERAKKFVRDTPENIRLRQELIKKLYSLKLVEADAKIDDVLGLTLRELLERRLQTIVYKKGLAMSVKQARQFITHGFIMVGDKKITSPSYIVKRDEEELVRIDPSSKLANPDHPEMIKILGRNKITKEEPEEKVEVVNKEGESS